MTILLQIGAFVLGLAVLGLAFKLLVKLRILPLLVWLGLGKGLYPSWSAAHPLIFCGVLAALALLMVFSWLGPWLESRRLERQVRDEIIRARAEGRTIDGIKMQNGVPVMTYRD
ncbi:MAG: hypothetical protein DBX60_07170 [Bacillota bacterium]|nr:MAG: hypothetical protein DBX60_07170 [Bacillota bacterium]